MAFVPGPTASRASGGQGPFVPVGDTNRDKRPAYPFVPVVSTNRDKMPPFCPGWCLQPGQKALASLSPSLSPCPSHLAHLFLAVHGSGDRSSCSFLHHICEDLLIPRPSIGAKGLGLVFLFFLGLYSSFHALEIEKMCS